MSAAEKHNHINEIEGFRNQAKRNLRKFNGIPKEYFRLYLKECEWRFNNGDPKIQLKKLNLWVKNLDRKARDLRYAVKSSQ